MKKSERMLEIITANAGASSDALPGMPLVEIIGQCRVLIENHKGVSAYCANRIHINVSYGELCVCGSGLKLAYMSKQRLVITGRIESVALCRRRE